MSVSSFVVTWEEPSRFTHIVERLESFPKISFRFPWSWLWLRFLHSSIHFAQSKTCKQKAQRNRYTSKATYKYLRETIPEIEKGMPPPNVFPAKFLQISFIVRHPRVVSKTKKVLSIITYRLWRFGGRLYGIWFPPPRLLLLKSLYQPQEIK